GVGRCDFSRTTGFGCPVSGFGKGVEACNLLARNLPDPCCAQHCCTLPALCSLLSALCSLLSAICYLLHSRFGESRPEENTHARNFPRRFVVTVPVLRSIPTTECFRPGGFHGCFAKQ